MSQGQLHNILIIESMFLAGILIAAGGIPAAVGITWNAIILVANITGKQKQKQTVTNQFNTVIFTAQRREKQDGREY